LFFIKTLFYLPYNKYVIFFVYYRNTKKLLPLTAKEPVAPVGNVTDGLIVNVPWLLILNLSLPPTLTVNTFPVGDEFEIKESDDVTAPVKFTEPVISALVVTIDSIDVDAPAVFLKNNLPSYVFTANSPNDKEPVDGTLDWVLLRFNVIFWATFYSLCYKYLTF